MEERSVSESDSLFSSMIGRVAMSLLKTHPKKLRNAISCLSFTPRVVYSPISLDESLRFFHQYIRDTAEREPLDSILVPMVEHSLESRKSMYGNQSMVLLIWLFEDDLLFQAVATNLANIILKKDDKYITLGWCILVRGLLEADIFTRMKKYYALLKIFCPCISQLLLIVNNGSILQDGFEFPTRLSMAAADCFLALSESLIGKQLPSDLIGETKSTKISLANQQPGMLFAAVDQKIVKPSTTAEVFHSLEIEMMLLDHLNDLIALLQKLITWSWKSRILHAKGLKRVVKWLQEIQESCRFQDKAGSNHMNDLVLLLTSCWKHYGALMHLEDHNICQNHRELLDQYLSGIQFYSDSIELHAETNVSGLQTIKFFINCLSLLLGRLDSKQLEITLSEHRLQISQLLISQLWTFDEDVIDGVLCIFNEVIFKAVDYSSFKDVAEQMDGEFLLLLNLLDEQDNISRAVIILTAEYCLRTKNDFCVQKILKRFTSVNLSQRRNAIDVISACIHRSSHSENLLNLSLRKDVANHLLESLKDEEFEIRMQASKLLPFIDHTLVLPALVQLVYSSNEIELLHASDVLMAVLKYNNNNHEAICMLLDCVSNYRQSLVLSDSSGGKGEGSKLDTDRVLMLIPEWSKTVTGWNNFIGPLIDKMFAEPSNAVIVRFLSYICGYLADASNIVLQRIILHTKGQKRVDEAVFSQCKNKLFTSADSLKLQESHFDQLCPLLIVKLLPYRIFNDVNSYTMYGELCNKGSQCDYGSFSFHNECVAALLFDRAFSKFEFDNVRKLAAELCGRLHPQVFFPFISHHLEYAARSRDILKLKTCLFSVCTSLAVRGGDSVSHHTIRKIIEVMESVLLWPSLDGDEVSKAQHGCIDCFALMICAELQVQDSFRNINLDQKTVITGGGSFVKFSVFRYVIQRLTCTESESIFVSATTSYTLPFRLCMANALISACQKISESGKRPLARETLPPIIHSIHVITESEIRAACIQVLFSSVFHLKSAVLPYAPELFEISLKFLKKGSEKEKMGGVKLLAAVMSSEDCVVESISSQLVKARSVLSSIFSIDDASSIAVKRICTQLLGFMSITR